jgi:DNA-binding XRE family transcriptional regulator
MSVQIIESDGKPAFAVVPMQEWKALLSQLENLQDIADAKVISARMETGDEEVFSADFVQRLLAGEHPLKVWRDHRGLTLQALGESCGCTRAMLSMIERGKAKPSVDLLGKLAAQLGCDMDDLTP